VPSTLLLCYELSFCIKKPNRVAQSEPSCCFYSLCHSRGKHFVYSHSNIFLFCVQIVLSALFKETNGYRYSTGPRVPAYVSRFYAKARDCVFRAISVRATYVRNRLTSSFRSSYMRHFESLNRETNLNNIIHFLAKQHITPSL
jgi:hypothetical protein